MRLPPLMPAWRCQYFAILGQRIVICPVQSRPRFAMVRRVKVPTRNPFLTTDGVATRLAIRELKKAKIDPGPLLAAAMPVIGFLSNGYQHSDEPLRLIPFR